MSRRSVLEAFGRVLRLETHNLSRWPELLWQQVHNELQWEGDDLQQALTGELSRRSDPDARPWLRRRTRLRQASELVQVLDGHESRVDDCAVSPDGSWFASASVDHTLRIWSVETGRELHTVRHDGPVSACAVSPDGSFVLTGSGGLVRLWDPLRGTEIRRLEPHEGWVGSCALSPDGSFAVGVVRDESDPNNSGLKIWDVPTGRVVRTIQGKEGIYDCAVAPDGSFVVSAGGAKRDRVVIWDHAKGKPRKKLKGHEASPGQARGTVLDCAVAQDGSFIVSAGDDFMLRIWDPASGRQLRRLGSSPDSTDPSLLADFEQIVYCCAVSPDGSWIAAGYEDAAVRLWDARTGQKLRTLEGHEDRVVACAIAADGSFLITGDMRGILRIWSLEGEGEAQEPQGHRGWVSDCAFAPDGSFIASAGEDATLNIWDPEASRLDRTLRGDQGGFNACAVFPEASVIASAGDDGTVRLWSSETGDLLRMLQPPAPARNPLGVGRRVNACAVSPDTSFVVSAQEAALSIWDPREGHEVTRFQPTTSGGQVGVEDCAVSPDASYVVSASPIGGGLWLWDPATGSEMRRLGRDGASACAVAPDGAFVVSAFGEVLGVWDPESGAQLVALRHGSFRACAVTPDARYVVTGGDDGTAVWEAGSGTLVAMVPLLGAVTSVDPHPSKPLIVCGDSAGTVNLVELENVELGSLVVTAFRDEGVLRFRCPSCLAYFRMEGSSEGLLGQEIDCKKCGCALRLNQFVLDRPQRQPSPASAGAEE